MGLTATHGVWLRGRVDAFLIGAPVSGESSGEWIPEAITRVQAEHLLAELARDDDNAAALQRLTGTGTWGLFDPSLAMHGVIEDIAWRLDSGALKLWRRQQPEGKAGASSDPPAVDLAELTNDETKTWFEVVFQDEIGEGIPDIALSLRVDGADESVTSDGSGKVRRDDAELSAANIKVSDYEGLRTTLKDRWTNVRDGEWIGPDDLPDHTFLVYAEPMKAISLRAETPHTVVIRPGVTRARLCGALFHTNKCFLLPSAMGHIRSIRELYDAHPGSDVLIVGHTDTTGDPSYNDPLSLERAQSMLAYLTDDIDAWLEWYGDGKDAQKRWGATEDHLMLGTVLAMNGENGGASPVRYFQESRGLEVDGVCGPNTRKQLVTEYMQIDGTTLPAGIEPTAHGCGENFPLAEDGVKLDHTPADGDEDITDRRVEVFFFDAPMGILPPPPGENSAKGSAEYPEWRKRARITDDFIVPPNEQLSTVEGVLFWKRTWDYNDHKTPIGAIEEVLPGAKVELRIKKKGGAKLEVHATVHLDDEGKFRFTNVPAVEEAALRIILEYEGGVITAMKGDKNAETHADFEVKKDKLIWHQLPLTAEQAAKIDGTAPLVDLEKVEITRELFVDLCDCYKSIWFGWTKIKELTEEEMPFCEVRYPAETISFESGGKLFILKGDLKDRDVLLHEYGHFITDKKVPAATNLGYDYDDGTGNLGAHNRTSQEHYESGWTEGIATFLSCALQDDPHYHDGYDADLDFHLDSDNTLVGPHCEGSIQEALWETFKVQGVPFKDMWKALVDTTHISVNTIIQYHDNWKKLGIGALDKLTAACKKFNMEFFYHYRAGADSWTAVAAPKAFDAAKKEFRTLDELFDNFGKEGAGTLAIYKEEFYNRNTVLNAGKLGAGSTFTDPKVVAGRTYIVPERKKLE
jgi:hypothetical protein